MSPHLRIRSPDDSQRPELDEVRAQYPSTRSAPRSEIPSAGQLPPRREAGVTLGPVTQAAAASTIPDDLSDLEAQAAKVLDPESLAYILAGAGNTDTTRANA